MMEDKKGLLLAGAIGTALLGVLVVLLYLIKPTGLREAHRESALPDGFHFPRSEAPGEAGVPLPALPSPAGLPPPAARETPENPGSRSASSLGFVRPASGLTFEPEAQEPPPQAPPAPPETVSPAAPLTANAIRAIMQEVVDLVRRRQPKWHREFLSHRELKAAADRYDRIRDFKRFVADLAASRAFHNMMRVRYRRAPMRELVREILGDKALSPKVLKLFFQNASDENAMGLMAKYGKEAGFPKDLVETAERRAPKRAAPAARTRPSLKKMDPNFTDRNAFK